MNRVSKIILFFLEQYLNCKKVNKIKHKPQLIGWAYKNTLNNSEDKLIKIKSSINLKYFKNKKMTTFNVSEF